MQLDRHACALQFLDRSADAIRGNVRPTFALMGQGRAGDDPLGLHLPAHLDCIRHAARAIIAGTLVVFGRTGANPGRGSKRGSIVALGGIDIPATYEYACAYQPAYIRLLLTYLQRQYGFSVETSSLDGIYNRYCGDMASLGRGEILELARL